MSAKRTGTLIDQFPPERRGELGELERMFCLWMLFFDAPEHTRLRKLMNKGFAPAVVESLRPLVDRIVDRMLEPLCHAHTADQLREFAHPLPAHVIPCDAKR